ncbi:efflux RND transporter periplasmic adaptor subunit [Marinigracilibium pacificum]|uniref:Efflux RND transporter periplasmic adaptor subunit n=1 Tax=Marinigracilibium pacificum TaxID=2729599 RepID=A0A848J192_9BACT|nr:efflux RND transporter periplasmic adaptor subunit [Marinigracilibium pacificum]NMM48069.1 efflux RND transporter periplasmic adaptor subunit [Marinigracilibium pacificum]
MAKRTNNRKLIIRVLLVLVVGLGILFALKKFKVIGGPQAEEVELAEAEARTITERVGATGVVQPVTEIKISPEVSGEIIKLHVVEGQKVKKGDILAELRKDNFELALNRTVANLNQQRASLKASESNMIKAKANLDRAKLDYDRNKKLYQEKVISDAEWQTAENNYQIAIQDYEAAQKNVEAARYNVASFQATVSDARENLSLTKIFAPQDGTISKLSVEEGETVVGTNQMAGTEMMILANLNNMEVRVDVNENDIIRISNNDTVEIDVDAYSHLDRMFKGVVTQIANTAKDKVSADAVTEFEVRILILNESYDDLPVESEGLSPFRPGMTASVEIITKTVSDALSIPIAAVTTRSDEPKFGKDAKKDAEKKSEDSDKGESEKGKKVEEVVFVYDETTNKVSKRIVETGISNFEYIQVTKGLKKGEKVVSGPFIAVSKNLEDGDLVAANEDDDDEQNLAKVDE